MKKQTVKKTVSLPAPFCSFPQTWISNTILYLILFDLYPKYFIFTTGILILLITKVIIELQIIAFLSGTALVGISYAHQLVFIMLHLSNTFPHCFGC